MPAESEGQQQAAAAALKDLSPEQQQASKLEEFWRIIAPLEQKQGGRLSGPGRAACIRAFHSYPDGFKAKASEALDRGRLPLGLLIRMVNDGDHEFEPEKLWEVGYWKTEPNESGNDESRRVPVTRFATHAEARQWANRYASSWWRQLTAEEASDGPSAQVIPLRPDVSADSDIVVDG